MNTSGKNINKKNKGNNSKIKEIKENKIKNNNRKVTHAKSTFPHDTEITNPNNISEIEGNEKNIIANILKIEQVLIQMVLATI